MAPEKASSVIRPLAAAMLIWMIPAIAGAATAKGLYESALTREQAVRARMADAASSKATGTEDPAAQALLKDIHAVENAYLAVVRQHPSSSYCDDALWNAGRLALDAYGRFGRSSDRETGLHLLTLLASQYPASKFARHVREQIAAAAPAPAAAQDAGPDTRAPVVGRVQAYRGDGLGRPAESPGAEGGVKGPAVVTGTVPSGPVGRESSRPARTEAADPEPSSTPAPRTVATQPPRRATIRGITRTVLPDVVRVTIDIDTEMPFHEERLDSPPRVFIDFPATRATPALVDQTIRFDGDSDIVRQVRIGRHPNATTRVVLDAAGVTGYSVYALYNPYRLVIDCARPTAAQGAPAVARTVAVPAPAKPAALWPPPELLDSLRLTTTWGRQLPTVTPAYRLAIEWARDAAVSVGTSGAAVAPTPAQALAPGTPGPLIAPPARNSAGGFSMARQLGLGVSRIVIDPGHGGHDPGAHGKDITEADLVLDVALRLEKLLQSQPGVEVVLTRRTDEFIPLQERTAIANREGADLFLSIHCNASETPQARGVETYFLNFANNLSAAAVAARENAASGQAMGALPDLVKEIALNNKLDESRDFAAHVQHAMIEKLRGANRTVKDLGVKQAPFVVLIGAAMPSVLAEVSFITNPQESKLLRGPAYRQRIAEALLTAVQKYQESLHDIRKGKVAAQ